MEPVMTGPLAYWHWLEKGPLPGGASLLNPIGWFLTSAAVAWIIAKTKQENRRVALVVLTGHLVLTFGIGAITLIPR
jgi:uncharacterized membrane protein